MTDEQIKFKAILDKHCEENFTSFTSNDFHTIWNAVKEYASLRLAEAEKRMPTVPKRDCANCQLNKHHYPGSAESVINGGNDSFDYDYCEKDCWIGEPEGEIPQREYCEFFRSRMEGGEK